MSLHPQVKWAQRQDKVYITVQLPDAKNAKVHLEPEGEFTFSANVGTDDKLYELKLDLFDKVNVEESKINIGTRSIFCVLEKVEANWWNKLLRGDAKAPHYVKVDWDKWVDEDEDTGAADVNTDGMDFSNLGGGMGGGMGGMESLMAGMGGGGGMGGMESLMAGMGGGGMGGMGGMAGMESLMKGMGGGMGGMDEFADSDEDEEVAKPGGVKAEGSKLEELTNSKSGEAGAAPAPAPAPATAPSST